MSQRLYLTYLDESMDGNFCVLSALAIPHDRWAESLESIKVMRKHWKTEYGIYVRKEIHTRDFVAGRGSLAPTVIPKGLRCFLFGELLATVAKLPEVMIFNAVCPKKKEDWAFERLLNRIQRNIEMKKAHAIMICDEGKEQLYPALARQMRVFNPIPSRYGGWAGGAATKQIPTQRVIEDPHFVRSERSYFIQLADACAYALLRRERPLASKTAYGLHLAFDALASVVVKEANPADPYGIIRVS